MNIRLAGFFGSARAGFGGVVVSRVGDSFKSLINFAFSRQQVVSQRSKNVQVDL